jgi:nucleotide-binding universal stress UspA family protein
MAQIERAFEARIGVLGGRRRVVVAVDSSTESISALRLAVAEARRIGATVDIVCASAAPDAYDDSAYTMRRYRDTYGPGQVMPPPPARPVERVSGECAEFYLRRAFPNGAPDVPVRIMMQVGARGDLMVDATYDAGPLRVVLKRVDAAQGGRHPADEEEHHGESNGRTTNPRGG